MQHENNTDTNQTPSSLNIPGESNWGETPPQPDKPVPSDVPPIEVPARPETPEHIPVKGSNPKNWLYLVK